MSLKVSRVVAVLLPILIVSGCDLLFGDVDLCDNNRVKNYYETIHDQFEIVDEADDRIGELFLRLDADPSLIEFGPWLSSLSDEVQKIVTASSKVKGLGSPHSDLDIAHRLLTGAFDAYSEAAKLYQEGIRRESNEDLRAGNDLIYEGNTKWSSGNQELRSILFDCHWF